MTGVIMKWFFPAGTGGTGPTLPGSGWGGGLGELDDDITVNVYAWEVDPAVTFTKISQTIIVDPRNAPGDTTTDAETYAGTIGAAVTALQGTGMKASLRFWKEMEVGATQQFNDNWWETLGAYVQPTIPTVLQDWWDAFTAQLVTDSILPDYKMHDYEKGMSYYSIAAVGISSAEDERRTYFEPITINDGSNPYPGGGGASPYIGDSIWEYGIDSTDSFIQEWEQWAVDMRTTYLSALTEDCPVFGENYSNFGDYDQDFEINDIRGFPNRMPNAQARLSDISSTPVYLDYNTDWTISDPEVTYSTTRQAINRRRWKTLIYRLNKIESAVSAGGREHPWIAPPGYGADGSDTWATASTLPFEKLFWRIKMRHLMALGIDTYLLWNPTSNNPNSVDTDTFMDAYFTGKTVTSSRRSGLAFTAYDSEVIQTDGRTTSYPNVYELEDVVYRVAASPIEPHSQGFCTADEPYVINTGATGVAELAALMDALAEIYGTTGPSTSTSGAIDIGRPTLPPE